MHLFYTLLTWYILRDANVTISCSGVQLLAVLRKCAVTTMKLRVELVRVNISLVKAILFISLNFCFKMALVVAYRCSMRPVIWNEK